MYGPLVIAYLFLGGAAAGALFAMAAWSLRMRAAQRGRRKPARLAAAFDTLRRRTYLTGFVMLALAMVCLLWDLGSPGKALLVLLRPHPTVLTFGAYTLAIEAALALLLASACVLGVPRFKERTFAALEALCCIGGLAAMSYTGVFLVGSGIPFWSSWTLVGLFTFSSLSAGISTVLLIDWLAQGQTVLLRAARPLQKAHLACLVAESVFLALFAYNAFADPAAAAARGLLLSPDMLATASVGVLGFGIAVPAAFEAYSLARTDCRTIPVVDVACLIGCLSLRYLVIVCGIR